MAPKNDKTTQTITKADVAPIPAGVVKQPGQSTDGLTLTDQHGRVLPVSCLPVHVTFTWADGRTERKSLEPKEFSTGNVGCYFGGKLDMDSPDKRGLQVSLNATYIKPGK